MFLAVPGSNATCMNNTTLAIGGLEAANAFASEKDELVAEYRTVEKQLAKVERR
jgi:hypothetical protein